MQSIKDKDIRQLDEIAKDIRHCIIDAVYKNGGHLSSNLGVVELTIALHFVFDVHRDRLLWDVGHQCYAHKLLTGRVLDKLRQDGGVTGFPNPAECDSDVFCVGHGTTSLSQALGLARARDINDKDHDVIAVIGDGAMSGGMAYEALNDIGASDTRLIVILNDNKMSISHNVGAISNHFAKLRTSKNYAVFKNNIRRGFEALPILGKSIIKLVRKIKSAWRQEIGNKIVEGMGIPYYGPYDGHDLATLINILRDIKKIRGPVFLHVLTQKGKGMDIAEKQPELYHGLAPSSTVQDYETESSERIVHAVRKDKGVAYKLPKDSTSDKSFSGIVGNYLCTVAQSHNIVAITAAMSGGTGLSRFAQLCPVRFFDVGMAEQHAVTMAAGLSKGGVKPFFVVYSTFLQRAYDQILHDVAINDMSVVLLIDRAGIVGSDGVTHQGIYDIAFLSQIDNMVIMSPKDGQQLQDMIDFSIHHVGPIAIRYPKSFETEYSTRHPVELGKWEFMREGGNSTVVVATGNRMLDIAMSCHHCDVVYATTIKPLDCTMLKSFRCKYSHVITMEDGIRVGGFGQQVSHTLSSYVKVTVLGHSGHITTLDVDSAMRMSNLYKDYIESIAHKKDDTVASNDRGL